MKLTVVTESGEKTISFEKGEKLSDLLIKNGFQINAACGGNGKCGKCKVKVVSGTESENGYVLACKTRLYNDAVVSLCEQRGEGLLDFGGLENSSSQSSGRGVALDIGTTTLACYLVDLAGGKVIDSASDLNPQRVFGADVINRIKAAKDGALDELHSLIADKTNALIEQLNAEQKGAPDILFVTGNTTMLHLFMNVNPQNMGVAPYTPEFVNSVSVFGREIGINAEKVTVAPSISAFVGGDVVCGGVATDLCSGNNLLVDLGTNGEMLLSSGGEIYCASTAAGPALEGAEISCGIGGVKGAIDSVSLDAEGNIKITTLGGGEPVGICGSGLIDAIAVMLELGVIDDTGAFTKCDKFFLSREIYIDGQDVRKFQLAKSAIAAGIIALCKRAGIDFSQIDNMYIAGGLGYYINGANAVKTGLIPARLAAKAKPVGNAAGKGAVMCMLSDKAAEYARKISEKAINLDLSKDPVFNEEYIENMFFDV